MSKTNEPVAWAVTPTGADAEIDCEFIYPAAATAGDVALGCDGVVVPLYRHTQAAITDAERELISRLAEEREDGHPRAWTNRALTADDRATLRGLLARLGGER